MKLLVVRTGITMNEACMAKISSTLTKLLPDVATIVISGENDEIETKFEVIEI